MLFVTRKWPPAVGGMETYAVELTRELARHVNLDVVSLPGKPDGSPPLKASFISFALKFWLHYWHSKSPPDVLHIADMASWPLALVVWTRRRRPKLVLSAHGTDVGYHRRGGLRGAFYGAYMRIGARLLRSAKVIANSAATSCAAAETGWRASAVVPLGTSLPDIGPSSSKYSDHLLFVGRLVERKGCRWFVENVLQHLPQEVKLHVAGTIWDEAEGSVLSHPRVKFIGQLHGIDLVEAYRNALCIVVPNIEPASGEFEGFGLVAAEAAAAGGVVLAANCGGIPEAVIDGETGILVPAGDAEAWQRKVEMIAAWSVAERKAFIIRSTDRARVHFNWSRVAQATLRAICSAE